MKAELERARTESHDKIRVLEEKLAVMEAEMNRVATEKEELDKEHEDLLVMLTEQDAKVLKYKVYLIVTLLTLHITNKKLQLPVPKFKWRMGTIF